MFNFDQSIAEWRRQMLAAGIKSPAPLEELEIHLREEIEERVQAGLSEADAFQAAVGTIGRGEQLHKEFKKVENRRGIYRTILLGAGWPAASWVLACAVVAWVFDWNLFHFSPHWDLRFVTCMSFAVVALGSMWLLAKASRDRASRVAGLLFCGLLLSGSFWFFPAEIIATPRAIPAPDPHMTGDQALRFIMKARVDNAISSVFSRSKPSPLWFRGGRMLLLWTPGLFWALWSWRHRTQKRDPSCGSGIMLSGS